MVDRRPAIDGPFSLSLSLSLYLSIDSAATLAMQNRSDRKRRVSSGFLLIFVFKIFFLLFGFRGSDRIDSITAVVFLVKTERAFGTAPTGRRGGGGGRGAGRPSMRRRPIGRRRIDGVPSAASCWNDSSLPSLTEFYRFFRGSGGWWMISQPVYRVYRVIFSEIFTTEGPFLFHFCVN